MGKVEIIVHQGAKEIGGNCIEIRDDTNRILLDFGTPFWFEDKAEGEKNIEILLKNGLLPSVEGLYKKSSSTPINAIMLSHPHKDHYGHLLFADKRIPIIIGNKTYHHFNSYWPLVRGDEKQLKKRFTVIQEEKEFTIQNSNIKITLVPVDHSATSSCGMLIDFNGTRIAYSGDIRFHGEKKDKSRDFVEKARNFMPEYLIIEGTHVKSKKSKYTGCRSEEEVKNRCKEIMQETKGAVILYCSTTNIDRIKVFGEAALESGRRFVMGYPIAFYTRNMRDKGVCPDILVPDSKAGEDRVRIFFRKKDAKANKNFRKHEIKNTEIEESKVALICGRDAIFEWGINKNSTVIYSMYTGYLNEGGFNFKFDAEVKDKNARFEVVHTSGHATYEELQMMIKEINPKKDGVIPVHCEEPELLKTVL